MSEPLSRWLALRQPFDHAARSEAITRKVAAMVARAHPLRIVDLGAGTGSNRRYLRPFLQSDQEWLLVDQDPALLSEATRGDDAGVATRVMNLGTLDANLFDDRHLVTASALLDLVSDTWLEALARQCRRVGAVALLALTYDGRSMCTPSDPGDDFVRELMNRHQRQNDKGFGRAAGPDAVDAADSAFRLVGYQVARATSDWKLSPAAHELQRELVNGWARAATELAPAEAARIAEWRSRRLAHIAAGRSSITVGHQDFAAWPGV